MFSSKNKVNDLPPRPKPPDTRQILEDLNNAENCDDVAFKLFAKDYADSSLHESSQNDFGKSSSSYERVKTYLDIIKKLKVLKLSLSEHEKLLLADIEDMMKLTKDIKNQAQAALIQ
ncbi:hypothetical protein TKK_0018036 [Trichogramma kaykai]|uniref:Uncharacterized protein n=1 Tax=Trichogramma kaykai TaxID=54128 RepID=A0ABD2W1D2_9HYME